MMICNYFLCDQAKGLMFDILIKYNYIINIKYSHYVEQFQLL